MSNPVVPSAIPHSGVLLLLASAVLLASGWAAADPRSTGHIVTTSVTKLDLAALTPNAFGDADEVR